MAGLPDLAFRITAQGQTAPAFATTRAEVEKTGLAMGKLSKEGANLGRVFKSFAAGSMPNFGNLANAAQLAGAAFTGFLNPAALISTALFAAATAGAQFVSSILNGSSDVEEALKLDVDLIKEIKTAYEDAGKAADAFRTGQARDQERRATANADAFRAALKEVQGNLAEDFASAPIAQLAGAAEAARLGITPLVDLTRQYAEAVRAGGGDLLAFRQQVEALAQADPTNKAMRDLADALLDQSKSGVAAAEGLERASAEIAVITGKATDAQRALLGMAAAMPKPGSMFAPSAREFENKSMADYWRALGVDVDPAFKPAATPTTTKGSVPSIGAPMDIRPKVVDDTRTAVDKLNDELRETKELTKDFTEDLVSGMRRGLSITETLGDAFGHLADRLISTGLDQLINSIFNPGSSLLGGAGAIAGTVFAINFGDKK